MEILGVILATAWLFLAIVYYTVFPTILNVAISAFLTTRLAAGRGFLLSTACFITVSFALTFASRLPDFLTDALGDHGYNSEISRQLDLLPGDTVNIPERFPAIEHRSSYFGTSGYEDVEMSTGIGGPNFYSEDIIHNLRGKGLRLNFGPPDPDAVTLDLEIQQGPTHQALTLTVRQGSTEIAQLSGSDRKHFLDEVGAGPFRHHLLHTMKNSLWNWILRFNQDKRSHPLTTFLEQVIQVADQRPDVPRHAVAAEFRTQALLSFNYRSLSNSGSGNFDCSQKDAPYVSSSSLRSRIDSEAYQLDLPWPTDGMSVEPSTYPGPRILRIACGEDGYMAWITGGPDVQRVVLTDKNWRPVAALDLVLPDMPATTAMYLNVLNFYQQSDSLFLESHLQDKAALPEGSGDSLVAFKVTHPILNSDYGSQANPIPGLSLFDAEEID